MYGILQHDLYAFPAILLGAFLEGEAAVISATVLSVLGSFHTWTVFAAGTLGTLMSDELVYWIGRSVRDPSRARLFGHAIISPKITQRARHFFERHGGAAVVILRFTYGTRTTGYFLAGASKMPFWKFFLADLLGTVTWMGALIGLGIAVGAPVLRYFEGSRAWVVAAGIIGTILVIVGIVVSIQKRIRLTPDTP